MITLFYMNFKLVYGRYACKTKNKLFELDIEFHYKNLPFTGKGHVYYKKHLLLEGEFKNGILNGKGKLYTMHKAFLCSTKTKLQFEGVFKDGFFYKGMCVYNGNKIYVGEFKNNLEHGHGKLNYPSGNKYEGEFEDGHRTKGRWYYKNGHVFEGEFNENGYMHGAGEIHYINGDILKGNWKDGNRNGKQILYYHIDNEISDNAKKVSIYKNKKKIGTTIANYFDTRIETNIDNRSICYYKINGKEKSKTISKHCKCNVTQIHDCNCVEKFVKLCIKNDTGFGTRLDRSIRYYFGNKN
jgi:hypothetical protein